MATPLLAPPMPPGEWDRVEVQRLRRRLLDSKHRRDLELLQQQHLGRMRSSIMGPVDDSANPFKVTCRELSSLYHDAASVRHPSKTATKTTARLLSRSGLWSQMQRFQASVLGVREYLLFVSPGLDGRLIYRPVAPDMVTVTPHDDAIDVPVEVRELRPFVVDGQPKWCWVVYDLRDPEVPYHALHLAEADGSLGRILVYDEWPAIYRRADETPVLPYVLYHAERLGDRIWDPWEGLELVRGSLNVGVLLGFWQHIVFNASYPVRYGAGARPAALTSVDESGRVTRQEVPTDPTSFLELEVVETAAGTTPQPQIGTLPPGGDPEAVLRAIDAYAHRLAQDAGVSASDIHRMSGDARSGYAISLTERGKRAAQNRYKPVFRRSDEELITLSAIVANRAFDAGLPEDGYSLTYAEIPLSPEEQKAHREHNLALYDRGFEFPHRTYMAFHPGITEEMAKADLEAIAREKARLTAIETMQTRLTAPAHNEEED